MTTIRASDLGPGDVTDPFNAALRDATLSAKPGDTISVEGTFDCEYGATWGALPFANAFPGLGRYGPTGLTLDCSSARLVQHDPTPFHPGGNGKPPIEPRRRYGTTGLHVVNASDCLIIAPTLQGSNPEGHDAGKTHEGWMGLQLSRCTRVTVESPTITNIWSDALSIVSAKDDLNHEVTIKNPTVDTTGRHAICWNNSVNTIISNASFRNVQHFILDHEAGEGCTATGLLLSGGSGGTGGHGFMQLRPHPQSDIGSVSVIGHRLDHGHFRILAFAAGKQRQGLTLTDLVSVDPSPWLGSHYSGALIQIGNMGAGWDGVTVSGISEHLGTNARGLDVSAACTGVEVGVNEWTTA